MDNYSDYVAIICGSFGDNYSPMTRSEFWKFYHAYGDSVDRLVESGDERVEELLKRSASTTFAMEKLQQMGIRIVTFLDEGFPSQLRSKLGDFCPPIFYSCGDPLINEHKFAGYVGSRTVSNDDIDWTERMIDKNIRKGFSVVTGGAKGIDNAALTYILDNGGKAVVFLPDNIKTKLRDSFYQQNILEGNLLIYSHVSPLERSGRTTFVAAAMERNKFIYAMSSATAVVKSDLKKGGTWSGATEALRHGWTKVFVWDNKNYPGNQKLIELGALPLSDEGLPLKVKNTSNNIKKVEDKTEQLSLLNMI